MTRSASPSGSRPSDRQGRPPERVPQNAVAAGSGARPDAPDRRRGGAPVVHRIRWSLLDLESVAERFWPKVDRSGGPASCWPWTAGTRPDGYGVFWIDGRMVAAHRIAWELTHGPIPEGNGYHGVCALHGCDTPLCCNSEHPDHLFLGTHAHNMADMAAKGRATNPVAEHHRRLTHCPQGHPYDDANTRYLRRGSRACRACDRQRAAARRQAARR